MTGNKFKHILASALLILPLALQVFAGASTVKADDVPSTPKPANAYIALHKVAWDTGNTPAGFDNDSVFNNDGEEVKDLQGGTPLNGVQFTAYDITDGYETKTSGTTKQRQQMVQDDPVTFAKNGQQIGAAQVTAGDGTAAGTANFVLPEKSTAEATKDKYAVYLIRETKSETDTTDPSKTVVKTASPLVLVMPLTKMGTKDAPLNIYPKNRTESTFTKDLTDESKTHMNGGNAALGLGDPAHYTVTAVVPSDIASLDAYKITDTPDLGLNIDVSSIKIVDDTNKEVLPEAKIATTDKTATAGVGFTIVYTPADLAKFAGDHLTITYTATINVALIPNDKLLNNKLQLNNEPNTTTSKTPITTGGAQFKKTDSETGDGLKGAEFIVVKGGKYLAESGKENVDKKYDWIALPDGHTKADTEAEAADFPGAKVLSSGDGGKFAITGLDYDTYELYEIKAPANYALLQQPFSFTVSETSYNKENSIDTEVPNAPKGELPHTGGMGIYIVIAVGLAIALAGVAFLRRGKHHEEV